jgi:1,2-diacylglycerol 3-beta-glucosyltransferase
MSVVLILAILAVAATSAVIVSFTYALGMYLEGHSGQDEPVGPAADLFHVFVIPCLNEERVIGATLDRLLAKPRENSVILVIDDGSDDRTAAVVQSRMGENVLLLRRHHPEARQGKGAALNAAVTYLAESPVLQGRAADEVVICLLDADGRLDPHAPDVAAASFADPRVGAVQVAVRIGNRDSGLLPRLQDMEFVCYTEMFQRCRSRAGFAGLGGNGQFTRLSALQSLGPEPWSPSTLTEDLDLGVRLVLAGWRTVYSNRAEVHQQGLDNLRRLVRQRSRWFQGLLQCWSLIPHIARKGAGRTRLDMLHMLLTPVLICAAFLMTLSFLVGPIERVVDPDLELGAFGTNQLVAWYLLTFFPVLLFAASYRAIAGVSRLRSVALGHVFVFYGLLWVAAGSQAIWRLLAGRKSWIKTDRLVEADETAATAAAQGHPRPALAGAERSDRVWADWYADAQRRARTEQARHVAAADAATDDWIAWYHRTHLLTSPAKTKDDKR